MFGKCDYDLQTLPPNVFYQHFYMGRNNCLLTKKHYSMDAYSEKHKKIIRALYKSFIKKNNIDIFLFLAPFEYYSCYDPEWFEGVYTVMVMHDLIPYIFPEQYLARQGTRAWYAEIMQFVKSADYILANSKDTKDTTVRYLGIKAEKIDIIYAGIQKEYRKRTYPDHAVETMKKTFDIRGEYIIMPGADDFRKNVPGTIEAYALLPEAVRKQYQLVITGGMCKESLKDMLEIVDKHDLADRVVFTGYVSVENFVMLYNKAKLMVFPSQYEGFGFPVAEAFACGTPVVTSNLGSLSEVAENAALVVDPYDAQDIARGILTGIQKYPAEMFAQAVQERLREYTWEKAAEKALCVFDKICKKKDLFVRRRAKIAVFMSFKLKDKRVMERNKAYIQALGEYADVDIYFDSEAEDTEEGGASRHFLQKFNAQYHEGFYSAPEPYEAVLYQISNDEACWFMFRYLDNYPGVLELADENYHEMLCGLSDRGGFNWDIYRKLIRKEVSDIDQYMDDIQKAPELFRKAVEQVCANRFLADRATKIIVHWDEAREKILEKSVGYEVRSFNLESADGLAYYNYILEPDDIGLLDGDLEAVWATLNNNILDANADLEYKRIAKTLGYIFSEEKETHSPLVVLEPGGVAHKTESIMKTIYAQFQEKGLDMESLKYGEE
jgi:glycosyltransferase involved in cell wall biosynthesis